MESLAIQSEDIGVIHALHAGAPDQGWILSRLDEVFHSIVTSILAGHEKVTIKLKRRLTGSYAIGPKNHLIRTTGGQRLSGVSYPGKTQKETWSFTVVLRILNTVHEALTNNTVVTKREIFYNDPKLYIRQEVVDRYVDDIACTLGVRRGCLNVVATAKGLVAGAIVITRKDGSTVSCAEDAQGLLIPNVREIRSIDVSAVAWVLVLEKEAAFRSLAVDLLWRQDGGGRGGVLVTGKGYPDISTRAFLHILATQFPAGLAPPIFALVDLDPDGVSIMSTYKYGSAALAHENAHLHVPGLQWLGVHSADLSEAAFSQEEDGRLSLTARDRRRATKLLGKDIFAEDGPERLWRREVQVMLMMNWKAEIQMLGRAEGGLATYLDARLAITAGAGHG